MSGVSVAAALVVTIAVLALFSLIGGLEDFYNKRQRLKEEEAKRIEFEERQRLEEEEAKRKERQRLEEEEAKRIELLRNEEEEEEKI